MPLASCVNATILEEMFTGSHVAAMPPKRKRAVEHVSAKVLRRKLLEGGKSEAEIKAIRGISALRSVLCQFQRLLHEGMKRTRYLNDARCQACAQVK